MSFSDADKDTIRIFGVPKNLLVEVLYFRFDHCRRTQSAFSSDFCLNRVQLFGM